MGLPAHSPLTETVREMLSSLQRCYKEGKEQNRSVTVQTHWVFTVSAFCSLLSWRHLLRVPWGSPWRAHGLFSWGTVRSVKWLHNDPLSLLEGFLGAVHSHVYCLDALSVFWQNQRETAHGREWNFKVEWSFEVTSNPNYSRILWSFPACQERVNPHLFWWCSVLCTHAVSRCQVQVLPPLSLTLQFLAWFSFHRLICLSPAESQGGGSRFHHPGEEWDPAGGGLQSAKCAWLHAWDNCGVHRSASLYPGWNLCEYHLFQRQTSDGFGLFFFWDGSVNDLFHSHSA